MSWLRKQWRYLLALGICAAGLLTLLVLYALRKRNESAALRAQMQLLLAATKVQGLQADRKARKAQLDANAEEAKKLDQQIRDARRSAVATVQSVDAMSDVDIANAFKKLGY